MLLKDKDMRQVLIPHLELVFDRVIQEKQIYNRGTVCADVVGLSPHQLVGYEIKSDADNLERLARQVKYYTWAFDKNYIVITEKYLSSISDHIPITWGIILITPDRDMEVIRRAEKTDNDFRTIYNLLWKQEIINKFKQDKIKGYSNKPAWRLFDLVKSTYSQREYEDYMRSCLLKRTDWKT